MMKLRWLIILPLAIAPSAAQDADITGLAKKCGSEIEWINDTYEAVDGKVQGEEERQKAMAAEAAEVRRLADAHRTREGGAA